MKALFLDGSPKYKDSNSLYILNALAEKLSPCCEIAWADARQCEIGNTADAIAASDAVVIGSPLYVDGIPSHLLAFLEQIADNLPKINHKLYIYTIVNNGFYDASQNHIAIKMVKIWCERCGFIWGQGVAAGAGEMVKAAPMGHGPSTNIGKALDELVITILKKQSGEIIFTEPNFPRILYKMAAHMGWYSTSKKNGVKRKDLYQKYYFEDTNGTADDKSF